MGCTGHIVDNGTPPGAGSGDDDPNGSGATSGSSGNTGKGGTGSGGSSGAGAGKGGSAGTAGNPTTATCDQGPYPATTDLHRLTPVQYANAIRDIFDGAIEPSKSYPASYGRSDTGYSTEQGINAVGDQSTEQLMNAAEETALAIADALPDLLPCSEDAADEACRDTFISTFARRAYRRPLESDEQQALTDAFAAAEADGATFGEAIAIMSAQLLQSPQFLYWVEDAADDKRQLTGYELASRLSLLLWDSIPDDDLLDAAAGKDLQDPEKLAEQATRMLASSKADPSLARLIREWTQTQELGPSDKDAKVFPFFTTDYAASMNESFDRFAIDQLRNDGTLETLLTSTKAFVDEQMADNYGVDAPAAGDWKQVSLDGTRYAGVMTQALVLATNAHANTSSYVFRGRMLRKRLLCEEFGPPPANAQAAFAAIPLPDDPTGKEAASAVQAQTVCGGCHKLLDPPGLAFEHFDAAGGYRDTYDSGRDIDTSGTLELDSGSYAFTSPVDLAAAIAKTPELQACFARQLFRFAFSRMETASDTCALKTLQDSLSASNGNLGQALLAVVSTDAFSWRADQ